MSIIHQDVEVSEAGSTPGKCPVVVPPTACAVLYDDENCEGWSFEVPTGTSDLPEEYRNDAEAVVVRSGCRLTGEPNGIEGDFIYCICTMGGRGSRGLKTAILGRKKVLKMQTKMQKNPEILYVINESPICPLI